MSLMESAPLPVERDHVTLMLQKLPAGILALQVFVWEKGPEMLIPVISKVVCPTLVSVVVSGREQTQ